MYLAGKNLKKLLVILPAIAALLLALIPTIKYQWPLGWDIIYHVQYAKIYAQYGFILTDPLLNAPYGQKIGYPPLFHFLIAALGTSLGINFFQAAKILQPIMAMSIVLSVSYVAYKYYGKIAGISAGFLMISSFLFSRMVLPLPENLALIFLPLTVFLYDRSLKDKHIITAILAGTLFIIVILTHTAASLSIFLIIVAITLFELIAHRDLGVLKNFTAFFLALILMFIAVLIILQIWAPQILQNIFQQGLSAATGISTYLTKNRPLGIFSYMKNLGFLVLIFSVIGIVIALKERSRKYMTILIWILVMFLLSNAYWFGVNIITFRVLTYLLIPLSIIGGFGLSYIYHHLKEYKPFSSKQFRTSFLVVVFAISILNGFITVENPKIGNFGVKNELGTVQIAPPSQSEVDLALWFQKNGNKQKSFITNNMFTGTFISTMTEIPMHYSSKYYLVSNGANKTLFDKQRIGYIVYDKRLVLPGQNSGLYMKMINSEYYPLFYSSVNISSNINSLKPSFSEVVYENKDYIVCKIS
jgi:asparagine N-glycosylation enzyme membrane subunit Stt3